MKILQIIYESFGSPFGFGGAGVRAYEVYKRLSGKHEITLLCMKYPGARDREIQGLRHVFVGTESTSLPKSVFAFTSQAARFVHRFGGDFDVIVENFLPATPYFSKFMSRSPVLLQIQGLWGRHYIKKFGFFYGLPMFVMEKLYLRLYRKFIFVTEVNMMQLIRRAEEYYIVPNGIGPDFLESNEPEGDYILFFSRIDTYHKGLDILFEAFARVGAKFPETRLVLAGYAVDNVDRLTQGLPAEMRCRVSYAGFVSGEEKKRILAGAKVFVLPSRIEAHPISILEAMACGTAVLVSGIAELKFVEAGQLGLTFPSGSVEGLAEKLDSLLRNEALRKELGARGREFARNNLWDSVALQFEAVLESSAREKR